jgi:capsular polysaccharide export protein
MIDASKGVVVVNSTVGLTALHRQRPTFALARPIYALDGLTSGGALKDFWRKPSMPQPELISSFEKLLMHTTQINGSYFNYRGIDLAIDEIVQRLRTQYSAL